MPCVELGDVMRAATVGVIEKSDNADWPVGKHVLGFGGVCELYEGCALVATERLCEADSRVQDSWSECLLPRRRVRRPAAHC